MTEDEKSQFKIDFEMNKKYSFKNNDKEFTLTENMITKIEEIKKNV